jgi:epoxyqueuosine reductase
MKQVLSDQTQAELVQQIRQWSRELGFQQLGISDCNLESAETHLQRWLNAGFHGEMGYMARHGLKRSRPQLLEPGTRSVICVRMNYLPEPMAQSWQRLADPATAFISRYALGRDYHKLMRKRLQQLAKRIGEQIGPFGHRVFVDSAPVLEKPLAEKAGLGWVGKHSNLINRRAGSWFFLGELYTDLPLPPDQPVKNHCGSCRACLDICPTRAIVAPYRVDARRCISYLTIELKGPIPVEFRHAIGNRIYGCDDCQLTCPWNRFAKLSTEPDFQPRQRFDSRILLDLFSWDEERFLKLTEGSAIRRIGHAAFLRNLAIALGNAPRQEAIVAALEGRMDSASALVREHLEWALQQQLSGKRNDAGN